jgi:hypothetical protein
MINKYSIMKKYVLVILWGLLVTQTNFSQELHIYGGSDHDVYLGCLNCNKFNSNSIWNAYGTYGSEYNTMSPWNKYSNDPPVIVDKAGDFYGYFTLNENKSKRAEFDLVKIIYEYHEFIMEDVTKWYDKIFQ